MKPATETGDDFGWTTADDFLLIKQSAADGPLAVYDSTANFVVIRQLYENQNEGMVFIRPENAAALSRAVQEVAGLLLYGEQSGQKPPEDISGLASAAAGRILTTAITWQRTGMAKLNHKKVAEIVAESIMADREIRARPASARVGS